MKVSIILASSRSDGNTNALVKAILDSRTARIYDLNKYSISHFDYDHKNQNDSFITIAKQISNSKTIVFATPVYWYAMTAQLKTFFDRMTDLVTIQKKIGRSLAGKNTFLLSCGTDKALPKGFEIPFDLTSRYFKMKYRGAFYWHVKNKNELKDLEVKDKIKAKRFGDKIFSA
ncbi:MAG TPA: flavodoxin family protein [bacterium]|nr:flavodoxin family protein [bacterium]